MSAARSTTAPTTLWTHIAGQRTTRWNTADRRLLAALPEALAHATPTQARRVRAYYIAGISQPEISRREGVDSSKVSVAIRRGLRNMRRCYDGLFPAE